MIDISISQYYQSDTQKGSPDNSPKQESALEFHEKLVKAIDLKLKHDLLNWQGTLHYLKD